MDSEPKNEARITVDPVASMQCVHCGAENACRDLEPFSTMPCPACGAELTVPARFGSFLLLNLINTGGMGCVYQARDETLGRLVAIKVMLSSLSEDATYFENFKREAQAAARLNHPHIAQIYSFGLERGQPYIVMELVRGKRFDKMISEQGKLDQGLVLRIGMDIAEGLRAADEIGLVHGDIKPENILLDEKSSAKLVDFGIASFTAEQGRPEGIWGTPYYIAPEKVRRQKIDARADIYSLGATLYHALAGRPPFDAATPMAVVRARLEREAPPVSELRKDIHPLVAATLTRMLQQQPALRHPTYASLLGDMKEALAAIGVDATAPAGKGIRRVLLHRQGAAAAPPDTPSDVPPQSAGRLVIRKGSIGRVSPLGDESTREQSASSVSALRILGAVVLILFLAGAAFGLWAWRQHRRDITAAAVEARKQEILLREQGEAVADLLKQAQGAAAEALRLSLAAQRSVADCSRISMSVFGRSPAELADTGAAPPDDEPAEKGALRELLVKANGLSTEGVVKAAFAREVLAAAEETAKSAQPIATVLLAKEYAEELEQYVAALRPLKAALAPLAQDGAKLTEQARAAKAALDKGIEERRKEEEARRKEEERKARIAAELSAVDALAAECVPFAQAFNFRVATTLVSNRMSRFETAEAREKWKNLSDRCQLLADWKAFLVQSLNARPFGWGWKRGGGASEDILGADDTSVKIRTGSVPWERVGAAQLARIVEHCTGAESVRPVARGRQYLATAVFFSLSGEQGLSATYAGKAGAVPTIQRDVDRLLPPAPAESAPPPSAEPAP